MRYPAVAGKFYPLDRRELIEQIESCFLHRLGPGRIGECSGERRIVGAVCPHAGYVCSGMNAAHVYKSIAEDGLPEAYVIIGPDHHGVPFDAVMCSDPYVTPLGECSVHSEILGNLLEFVRDSPNAHRFEHSVEVQVPFIQYIDPGAKIVPIIMRDQSKEAAERLGYVLAKACEGIDTVIIASSDLSHYVPKPVAERNDSMVLDSIGKMDIGRMYDSIMTHDISACGYGPIAAAMIGSRADKAEILKHSDSWDSLNYDRDAVVGYGSAIFTRDRVIDEHPLDKTCSLRFESH